MNFIDFLKNLLLFHRFSLLFSYFWFYWFLPLSLLFSSLSLLSIPLERGQGCNQIYYILKNSVLCDLLTRGRVKHKKRHLRGRSWVSTSVPGAEEGKEAKIKQKGWAGRGAEPTWSSESASQTPGRQHLTPTRIAGTKYTDNRKYWIGTPQLLVRL